MFKFCAYIRKGYRQLPCYFGISTWNSYIILDNLLKTKVVNNLELIAENFIKNTQEIDFFFSMLNKTRKKNYNLTGMVNFATNPSEHIKLPQNKKGENGRRGVAGCSYENLPEFDIY